MAPAVAMTPRAARTLRVLLAQINTMVGDVPGNVERVTEVLDRAREGRADLVVFPELTLTGYPPEDLLLRPSIIAACEAALPDLAACSRGLTVLVGFPQRGETDLFNAAAVLHDGDLAAVYHKWYLPNYSVFDEARYFSQGTEALTLRRAEARIGVSICEDIWHPEGPARIEALCGADVLVNLSSSPYRQGKARDRERMLATRAADNRAFVVFCNLVGGQDELVFDGGSLVVDPAGRIVARGAAFDEDLIWIDLHPEEAFRRRLLDPRQRHTPVPEGGNKEVGLADVASEARPPLAPRTMPEPLAPLEEVYRALVCATRDYARKNGFRKAVVGVSGGIDSALTASIAVDALGADNVLGVGMPTRFSSKGSLSDAQGLAANLGMSFEQIAIDDVFQAYLDALAAVFEGTEEGVTEENLQPRVRGNVLMALSNKFGHLVLTTGNKSEASVGFATLYGDTAGGFAPLKDVLKTRVYELARWRNARQAGPWIPEASIAKAPSPELKPNQTDQDVLPPYDILDPILVAYVEEEKSIPEIVDMGFDRDVVTWVADRVDRAEYKRRQSPPGVRITNRAFGRDRRMPITKRGR